ncbi:hypothetical protein L9F63_016386 [Diploptera punctata]|uniref:Odorant receptor n=1 Tax=Diploptera punctata TaxID=6984 RepID=A0AAD8A1F6_DIPPU|nr:hypothetical protein L9F63_016386 [Diploptera punctata]
MGVEDNDIELKTRNCMKLCVNLLEISGIWYSGEAKSIARHLYNKFVVILAFVWAFCIYAKLYTSRDDFDELLDASPLLTAPTDSNNTTEIVRPLPIKVWMPFDQMVSPYYEFAYVFTTFCCLMFGGIIVTADVLFFVVMIYVTGQFTLLNDSLTNMKANVYKMFSNDHKNGDSFVIKREKSAEKVDQNISMAQLKIIHLEAEKYLRNCIKHHQSLIEKYSFNDLWSTYFFVECLTASVLICFLGFKAMTMDMDINLIKMLVYLLTVIFQLALQCAYGSNLMTESESVYNAVYSSDWYNQSNQYKQFARMMIMHAQKPVKIMAGRFGVMSLPLFAGMMRSSYSYIALLRQMQEE